MRVLIFDTETTGLVRPAAVPLEQQPRIIELGVLVIENAEIVEQHNWLFNPGIPLPAIITKITGIQDSDVKEKPRFEEEASAINYLFSTGALVVAHNAMFDVTMVNNEFARLGLKSPLPLKIICTVEAYKHLFNKWPKLTELYQLILGKPLAQTHRAVDDCLALYEILKADKFFDIVEKR